MSENRINIVRVEGESPLAIVTPKNGGLAYRPITMDQALKLHAVLHHGLIYGFPKDAQSKDVFELAHSVKDFNP